MGEPWWSCMCSEKVISQGLGGREEGFDSGRLADWTAGTRKANLGM